MIAGQKDEVEPDGMPNSAGIPTSTLHTNIWYHLGLAHYLQGDYEQALAAYEKCLQASTNNDMTVATLDWIWMTNMRLGKTKAARSAVAGINQKTQVIENFAYRKRLLLYRGLIEPTDLISQDEGADKDLDLATYGYGLGNWYQVNGDLDRANEYYEKVISGKYWAAFGYIAAEAELANQRAATK